MSDTNGGDDSKGFTGWKRTLIIGIFLAFIPVIFGSSWLVSIINNILFNPNITINWLTNSSTPNNGTVSFANKGSATATNVLLTIQSPTINTNYSIFSTENYSLSHKPNGKSPWMLQLRIPRFAQGAGSIVSVDLFDKGSITSQNPLVAFTTYDQGSSKEESKPQEKHGPTSGDELERFWNIISPGSDVLAILTIISSGIAGFIAAVFRKRQTFKKSI